MNRDFLIDEVTPAIARKLTSVMPSARTYIDPKLLERAKEDLIETTETGIVRDLMQYIADYEYRCVIPFQHSVRELRRGISLMIPDDQRVLFIDDPLNWNMLLRTNLKPYQSESGTRFQFLSTGAPSTFEAKDVRGLLMDRDMMIVIRATDIHPQSFGWIGQAFSKVILYLEPTQQFTLSFKAGFNYNVLSAAACLYPYLNTMVPQLNAMPPSKLHPLIGATKIFLNKEEKK